MEALHAGGRRGRPCKCGERDCPGWQMVSDVGWADPFVRYRAGVISREQMDAEYEAADTPHGGVSGGLLVDMGRPVPPATTEGRGSSEIQRPHGTMPVVLEEEGRLGKGPGSGIEQGGAHGMPDAGMWAASRANPVHTPVSRDAADAEVIADYVQEEALKHEETEDAKLKRETTRHPDDVAREQGEPTLAEREAKLHEEKAKELAAADDRKAADAKHRADRVDARRDAREGRQDARHDTAEAREADREADRDADHEARRHQAAVEGEAPEAAERTAAVEKAGQAEGATRREREAPKPTQRKK